MYSSSPHPSTTRPSSFSFDSTPPSVIVSHPSLPLPSDLPDRPADTPTYTTAYYGPGGETYGFVPNYGYPLPFFLGFDMRSQTSEGSSCAGTPTLPFLQTDFNLSNFSGQLTPLGSTPFSSTVYGGNSVIPSMGVSRRTGGRRPKEAIMYDAEMDPEESDKKTKRRLRNKEAAARCRARRLQLMNELQDKVDQFKRDSRAKSDEIKVLQEKVSRLQSFLQGHECKLSPEERNKILSSFAQQQQQASMMNRFNMNPHMASSSRSIAPPMASTHSAHHMNNQIENTFPAQIRVAKRDSTDYVPQVFENRAAKRVATSGEESMFGQSHMKMPKVEVSESSMDASEKTLTQLNQRRDDLERPQEFKLECGGPTSSACVSLTTPSRDLPNAFTGPVPLSFPTPAFSGNCNPNNILNETTGFTPTNQPTTTFSIGSNTPLQNNDLKSL